MIINNSNCKNNWQNINIGKLRATLHFYVYILTSTYFIRLSHSFSSTENLLISKKLLFYLFIIRLRFILIAINTLEGVDCGRMSITFHLFYLYFTFIYMVLLRLQFIHVTHLVYGYFNFSEDFIRFNFEDSVTPIFINYVLIQNCQYYYPMFY